MIGRQYAPVTEATASTTERAENKQASCHCFNRCCRPLPLAICALLVTSLLTLAIAGWSLELLRRFSVLRTPAIEELESLRAFPLQYAHSHNDYQHTRPLYDALDRGFCSVEADVHLTGIDDDLLVGHILPGTFTFREQYLQPLQHIAETNQGRIIRRGFRLGVCRTFLLWVDVKTAAYETWSRLQKELNDFPELVHCANSTSNFVRVTDMSHRTRPPAVSVIVSGHTPSPIELDKAPGPVCSFLDARWQAKDEVGGWAEQKSKLEAGMPYHYSAISDRWGRQFSWDGNGQLSRTESKHLQSLVDEAHQHGMIIRFWGTPDSDTLWDTLLMAGVDLIGSDQLSRLQQFLLSNCSSSTLRDSHWACGT